MRLYSMYFLCKENIDAVEAINVQTKNSGNSTTYYIANWKKAAILLNKLATMPCIRPAATELFETIPTVQRDKDQFDIDITTRNKFIAAKRNLQSRMDTIIRLYGDSRVEKEEEYGFDVKLPDFKSFDELVDCMDDLKFVLNQCPYLNISDAKVEYQSADVGSFWINFVVAGTAAAALLLNLSKVVETAVKIKSQVITVKQQEEQLRAMQEKNKLAGEIIETFRQVNKSLTDDYVRNLEAELGKLPEREAADKVGKSIEKLGYWMDKGLQIYSAIDAPKDVKLLFPQQEEPKLLDDVAKLIEETKKENKGQK